MIQENEDQTNKEDHTADAKADKPKVTIEFPYSDLLRAQAPKVFDVAEKVATDWKHEGDFTELGIGHPVADMVAHQALTKAKEVEKKLDEKGVFTLAKLGLDIAKSQVEILKSKINK